jgi:hypothetical protein
MNICFIGGRSYIGEVHTKKKKEMKKIDLTNKRFGRLVVIKQVNQIKGNVVKWLCRCDCGKVKVIDGRRLRDKLTKSCGCLKTDKLIKRNTKHGMCGTPIHNVWKAIIQRCENNKNKQYCLYGARGINVCVVWHEFDNFYKDMGECPLGLTIERVDNNKGYYKENCEWATYIAQARNRRTRRDSKSGITGIYWNKRDRKYQVEISANGKRNYIGCFMNLDEVKIAREQAERQYWA